MYVYTFVVFLSFGILSGCSSKPLPPEASDGNGTSIGSINSPAPSESTAPPMPVVTAHYFGSGA